MPRSCCFTGHVGSVTKSTVIEKIAWQLANIRVHTVLYAARYTTLVTVHCGGRLSRSPQQMNRIWLALLKSDEQ